MKTVKLRNSLLLMLAAIIWGVAFVAQSEGGDAVGPFAFNSVRFLIGALVLRPVIAFLDKQNAGAKKPVTAEEKHLLWKGGALCGAALFVASNLQQVGIWLGAESGRAGFLTACYILLVPIVSLFLKKKCGWNIWVGVLIALCGLYLLCMNEAFGLAPADILLLLCALSFSVQILLVDYFGPKVDPVRLSSLQFLICGLLTAIPMFFYDMQYSVSGVMNVIDSFANPTAWITILYAGVMSSGVAYTLQIVGQVGLNPTIASLIMSLESVFAALAGWILLKQVMSGRELLGCVLIFAAIVLAQIPVKQAKD